MYVTKNLSQTHAQYIDLSDPEFFHQAIKIAINRYKNDIKNDIIYTQDDIDNIKKYKTPAIFGTTVYKKEAGDVFFPRKEFGNDKLRRKYLIIDADFNKEEEGISDYLRYKLIKLAENYNTPIVIYPTISFPEKPRFRVVFFVKRQLNEKNYFKAMSWLYGQIGIEPLDPNDMRINNSNNAPVFTNESQIENIIDTTQADNLEYLDNKLWKDYKAPKKRTFKSNDYFDKLTLHENEFYDAINKFNINDYDDFWKFANSIVRAEQANQINEKQALDAMEIIAKNASSNEEEFNQWRAGNIDFYQNSKSRAQSGSLNLNLAKPLMKYNEFKEIILNDKKSLN